MAFFWGIALAIGVCIPFFGTHRLLLLDWSFGPVQAVTNEATLGLNGGLLAGNFPSVMMALLNHVVGPFETWLPIFAFFPIATVGIARLVKSSRWAQIAAASLYAVNPFVLNRIFAGQLTFLLGYALLPFALASAVRSPSLKVMRWLVVPVWWGVLTALSPHFAWIYGLVLLAVAFLNLVYGQLRSMRVLIWFVLSSAVFAAMSAYIYLPTISTTLPTKVGATSLALYRTSSDPHFGLYANLLALYGFWRLGPGPQLAKDVITGWPFLMAALLVIIAVGMEHNLRFRYHFEQLALHEGIDTPMSNARTLRRDSQPPDADDTQRRIQLALILLVIGAFGYFLALGNQGPTGGLFTLLYDRLPFFAIMREPQKFLVLLIQAYAVFFGWGVERLLQMYKARNRAVAVICALVVAIAMPLGYTANIFNGLSRQLVPSSIPSSYSQANTLMGKGDGNVLALPWHLYMSYPFTHNRVVANIAPGVFDRNVLSGDNVESGGVESESTSRRSLYLESVFSNGHRLQNFGALVAPLGVEYISLSKTVDWGSYSWLNRQHDLTLVLNSPSLEIWRNTSYFGVGQSVASLTKVSTFQELLRLPSVNALSGAVYKNFRVPSSTSVSDSSSKTSPIKHQVNIVREVSPVAYKIGPGAPGWVEVDASYQKGWTLNGHSAVDSVEGTLLVRVDSRGGTLVFSPWSSVRTGYIVSGGVLFLCVALLVSSRWREKLKTASEPGDDEF